MYGSLRSTMGVLFSGKFCRNHPPPFPPFLFFIYFFFLLRWRLASQKQYFLFSLSQLGIRIYLRGRWGLFGPFVTTALLFRRWGPCLVRESGWLYIEEGPDRQASQDERSESQNHYSNDVTWRRAGSCSGMSEGERGI